MLSNMKLNVYLITLLFITSLSFAQRGKSSAAPVEVKVPNWVSHRPSGSFKYVGIGVADKARTADFKMEAKKNALYDLASEIKVDISTNSVLHSVSSNNSFDQNFNSLIKLSNSDNIEGYTLVDSYENDKQYWVYYELDKAEYAKRKAQKKQNTITKAAQLIALSFEDDKKQNFSASLKKRIQAFGVLNPYLSEEIVFDPAQSNGVKNVFELTNLIQNQLQSISVSLPPQVPVVKPYQPVYNPVGFKISIQNASPLNDFPFKLSNDEDILKIEEQSTTNVAGILQLKVNYVEPQFMMTNITLNPDIERLTANDSVSKSSIAILKQFIQTPSLKVQLNIEPVSLYILAKENNYGKALQTNMIEQFVQQKFNSIEMKIVEDPKQADYQLELSANTNPDISSAVLQKIYQLNLAQLNINLSLKNNKGEVIYKNVVGDIFGYANNAEKAGLNAYSSTKLKSKLGEALFFAKRKMINY
jgi:hypothetical protein